MIEKFGKEHSGYIYFVFRIIVGILFLFHGIAKWGTITSDLFSMFGIAGVIEIIAGILIIVGYKVRWVALIAAIEMLVAFFVIHGAKGFNPFSNGGELALMFFVSFLVLWAHGAGIWAVDRR